MKFSDMSTESSFDLMEKLLPIVSSIMADEEVQTVKGVIKRDDESKVNIRQSYSPVMSLFLGKHREDMYMMCAAMSGRTVKDVKAQPLSETLEALQQALDGEMMSFFALCLRMVMTA